MFAIIKTGGKQYLAKEGAKLKVEKLAQKEGRKINFKEILLVGDASTASVKIGEPLVKGAKVEGKIIKQSRHPKITIIKHKPKKRYLVKKGHKQPFSQIEITKISAK